MRLKTMLNSYNASFCPLLNSNVDAAFASKPVSYDVPTPSYAPTVGEAVDFIQREMDNRNALGYGLRMGLEKLTGASTDTESSSSFNLISYLSKAQALMIKVRDNFLAAFQTPPFANYMSSNDEYEREEKLAEKEYFESRMAITLSLRPDLFPVVQLVSDKIQELIAINREKIISIFIEKSEKDYIKAINLIKNGLYKKNKDNGPLGGIPESTEELSIERILIDIEKALKTAKTLVQIMPIHAAFGYHIARLLDETAYLEFKTHLELLSPNVKNCKTSKADDEAIALTDQFGISNSKIYCKLLNESKEAEDLRAIIDPFHRNSLQRYEIDLKHPALKIFLENDVPLAACPSSHAVTILTAARLYQKLLGYEFTMPMQYEYSMAYFSYLTTAGYHSFHEVMSVAAKCTGRPYDMSNYRSNIPVEIYEFIQRSIPEFTEECFSLAAQSSSGTSIVFSEAVDEKRSYISETSCSSEYASPMKGVRCY